jgi:4-hydroxy-tetrahydrodipicolinate synthase
MCFDKDFEFTIWTMTVTPFRGDGSLDEDALRTLLRRLVAAQCGIYVTNAGSGEASALTLAEHRRIFDIAVKEAKGKVPVAANVQPCRTVEEAYAICKEAMAARVDHVAIYQFLPQMGMIPSAAEQERFWDELLDQVDYPVAIAFNHQVGYTAKEAFILRLCAKHKQIFQVNTPPGFGAGLLTGGQRLETFMTLRDALPPSVKLTSGLGFFPGVIQLGSVGVQIAEPNIIPNICRGMVDGYRYGDTKKTREHIQAFQRFTDLGREWHPATARWCKMAMKVLGLGNGVLRPPYVLPGDDDQRRMAEGLARIGTAELEARAFAPFATA